MPYRNLAHPLPIEDSPKPTKLKKNFFSLLIWVTYSLFDPFLSDKDQFPFLYQMVSKNSSLIHGMILLLLHFGWTWVTLFFSEDREGEQFLWDLKAEMVQKGICVAFTKKIPNRRELYEVMDVNFMSRT